MKSQACTVGILSVTIILNALMLAVFFTPSYADNELFVGPIISDPQFETCTQDVRTPELRPPIIAIPISKAPEPKKQEPVIEELVVEPAPAPEPVVTYERKKRLDIPLSGEIQDYIYETCLTYNVPFELVIAIMKEESLFRADIISRTNDYGLMQINQVNHEWLSEKLGISNFLDPKQNALAGIYILSLHMKYCNNDVIKALMCYGLGAGGAQKLWNQGIYTTKFVEKMMAIYGEFLEESHNYD
jgi:hypothetical protein